MLNTNLSILELNILKKSSHVAYDQVSVEYRSIPNFFFKNKKKLSVIPYILEDQVKSYNAIKSSHLTFFSQGSPHDILPNIILLSQVEELADLAGPLGTKTTRDSAGGQPGNVLLT